MFSKPSMFLCSIGIIIFLIQIITGYYSFLFYPGLTLYILGFILGIAAFAKSEKSKAKYFSVVSFVVIPIVFYLFFLLWAFQIGEK
ncbi:hypothetical protein C1N87_27440 (plasmid) [Priestia aryabhattai]